MMEFEDFKRGLSVVKNDYQLLEKKCKLFLDGVSSFIDDANGVVAPWLYDIVKNEMKNLVYATAPEKLLGKGSDWKDVDDKVNDFIDYYMFEADFGGDISWTDEDGGHRYDLSDDEQLFEYIQKGLVA